MCQYASSYPVKQKTCTVKLLDSPLSLPPTATIAVRLILRIEERLDLLGHELEVGSVVTPGRARRDRTLVGLATALDASRVEDAVDRAVDDADRGGPHRDRADDARRACGARRAGRPRWALRSGRSRRKLARSEVRPQQRAVRDLGRVDGIRPDLRARHGRKLQLRRAHAVPRELTHGRDARPSERDQQCQARDHHCRRRPPAPELSHVSSSFRVSCRPGYPWPRPIPSRRRKPLRFSYAAEVVAISTDSKYSPARRPVRRLTCRSRRSSSRSPLRRRISG